MRTVIVVMLVVSCMGILQGQDSATEREAVTATAMNYIEGWYEGNAERMDKALNPELSKCGIQAFRPTGGVLLAYLKKSNMMEYTRAGLGKLPAEEREIEVTILDIHGSMAAVKVSSVKFTDYLQLAKIDGSWSILQVLWVPNN